MELEPPRLARVATCNLNQWALDYDGNLARTLASVRAAKAAGARFRLGPELELTGYGCEDHFLEADTLAHAWESLAALLAGDATDECLCDVGIPALHRGVRYNCRALCLNRRVVLLRPKVALADAGNYRESRWFTAWRADVRRELEDFELPACVVAATGQRTAPIGIALVATRGAMLASETCEELFTPAAPHIALGLAGADIIANGSASHHELRKLDTRVDLMRAATASGGAYLYANQQGCDGGRLYYDGCALAMVNGQCVGQASQFGVAEVEVVVVTIDVDAVRSFRGALASRGVQGAAAPPLPVIAIDFSLAPALGADAQPTPARPLRFHTPEEEIALGPACWLWDFLRRSGAGGFLLPLSGGADSAATCALVGVMCHVVHAACVAGDAAALADVRRVLREGAAYMPAAPRELAHRVMHTAYLGAAQSSAETRARAAALAAEVGTFHVQADIDAAVAAMLALVAAALPAAAAPRFAAHGGSRGEDLALQNLQARLRMVAAYLLAQLLPWARGARGGFLLVLGSANVDEALRGYMTKYDCSSADINPIGGVAKRDLGAFLAHAARAYGYGALRGVLAAPPTAELVPPRADAGAGGTAPAQLDEVDMGMTYDELAVFGRLRKVERCGPASMYRRLLAAWPQLPPAAVAEKVRHFFACYAANRHKMTTLTPSYHAEAYGPDDNRFDLRPFLCDAAFARDARAIAADVRAREARLAAAPAPEPPRA